MFHLQPHQFDSYFILASINFIPPLLRTYTAVKRRMNIQRAFSYNLDSLLVKNLMVNTENIYSHVEDFDVRF